MANNNFTEEDKLLLDACRRYILICRKTPKEFCESLYDMARDSLVEEEELCKESLSACA